MERSKYEEAIKQIFDESISKKPVEVSDDTLLSSIKYQDEEKDPEYDRRNRFYTELLSTYIKSYISISGYKKWYKLAFFIIVMLVFVFIVVFCVIGIVHISLKENTTVADFGVLFSSIAGILSALLVLPKVIAEHLFPKDEDANMIDMVKNMQQNDSGIRNWLHNNKHDSDKK